MKVLLLFPPDWLPSEPYLSLPSLTSVLRPAGHEVIQKDDKIIGILTGRQKEPLLPIEYHNDSSNTFARPPKK